MATQHKVVFIILDNQILTNTMVHDFVFQEDENIVDIRRILFRYAFADNIGNREHISIYQNESNDLIENREELLPGSLLRVILNRD